jgi:hypothetical protein
MKLSNCAAKFKISTTKPIQMQSSIRTTSTKSLDSPPKSVVNVSSRTLAQFHSSHQSPSLILSPDQQKQWPYTYCCGIIGGLLFFMVTTLSIWLIVPYYFLTNIEVKSSGFERSFLVKLSNNLILFFHFSWNKPKRCPLNESCNVCAYQSLKFLNFSLFSLSMVTLTSGWKNLNCITNCKSWF